MGMKDKSIRIDCWSGRILFIGPYDDDKVDRVLDANRCECRYDSELSHEIDVCDKCDGTGYKGDFEVSWVDEANDGLNVCEYINY